MNKDDCQRVVDDCKALIAEEAPFRQQTPREKLFTLHSALSADALNLMKKKNMDYGGDTDPYRNFRLFGGLGILVRLSDKLARLRTFEERGKFSVEDEGVRDTIVDILNYAVLLYGYQLEEGKVK